MLTMLIAAASLAATSQQALAPPADPCAGEANCAQASAAQLFDLADKLFAAGDLDGAEEILIALQQDPHLELRSEARFRLAALREKKGDLDGAIAALRDLLAEQPDANPPRLELARLLARKGDAAAARAELKRASAAGLPPEVQATVQTFSSSLVSQRRRGASLELVGGPDSNMNRSTSDRYIDTIIAPFELDPDARGQSGIGFGAGGQLWSRNRVAGMEWLSRLGAHADLFTKSQFNDIQLGLSSGPEVQTGIGRLRVAAQLERRWYGGDPYSKGYGGAVDWLSPVWDNGQFSADASIVRQFIHNNAVLDGTRYAAGLAYDRALGSLTTARVSLRFSALDAEAEPESVRQLGGDLLLAHRFVPVTAFAQLGYGGSWGLAPLALFGRTRDDKRFDLGGGLIFNSLRFAGFAPLARLSYTTSRSNIALYDYKRTRLDFGFSREF